MLFLWSRKEDEVEKGARMQLTLVFEIVLLVAIVAGVFVGWDVRPDEQRRRPKRR